MTGIRKDGLTVERFFRLAGDEDLPDRALQ